MSKNRVQAFIFDPLDEVMIHAAVNGIATKYYNVLRQETPDVKVEHTFIDVWFEVDNDADDFNDWLKDIHTVTGRGGIYTCSHDDLHRKRDKIPNDKKWEKP